MKESILFVTNSSNWPLTDGKRQRTWFLIEALSKKFHVDVLLIGFEEDKKQIEESRSSIRELYYVNLIDSFFLQPGYPSVLLSKKQKAQKQLFFQQTADLYLKIQDQNSYSYVFSRYLQPLLVLPLSNKTKVVCDIDDVYFEAQQSRIQKETLFLRKLKLQLLFLLGSNTIKTILNRIDIPIIVKNSDRSFSALKNAVCIPNLPFGFYIDQEPFFTAVNFLENPSGLRFGFIGKLSYRPNYQGLIWFITHVWNPLMEKGFSARFVIAGSGAIPLILQSVITSSKNIDLLGFVASPDLFWNQISSLVVPVAEGGGTNIKIAEALMFGKSILAHPFASRGYEAFLDSGYLLLSENDADWIRFMQEIPVPSPEQSRQITSKAKALFDLERWNQMVLEALA